MSAEEDFKKIDAKKHKKHAHFLLYSYCHYILEIYNRLSDKPDMNFGVLIPLINNYILNLFTICLANQINLDVTKSIIDESVLITLDYISISHEDEFREQNYNPRFNDAIHFSYQKMHDRILGVIPNKPIASIITNLPTGMLLSTSPRSLPNNMDSPIQLHAQRGQGIQSGMPAGIHCKSTSIKRRLPNPGLTSALSNYISIIGASGNKTSRSIIYTAEIITRIFNLFAVTYGLDIGKNSHKHKNMLLNWLEIFEPIRPGSLLDDLPEDDAQYSNSVFFTRLTYNLDILECFINMLLPQLLKLSQSLVGQLDMTRGHQIACDITQIYRRLTTNIHVPGFILLTMIYNYLITCVDNLDYDTLVGINNCCQIGTYLGYLNSTGLENASGLSSVQEKYFNALQQLRVVLGISYLPTNKNHSQHININININKSNTIHQKKINNKNLITAIITLNNYIMDV